MLQTLPRHGVCSQVLPAIVPKNLWEIHECMLWSVTKYEKLSRAQPFGIFSMPNNLLHHWLFPETTCRSEPDKSQSSPLWTRLTVTVKHFFTGHWCIKCHNILQVTKLIGRSIPFLPAPRYNLSSLCYHVVCEIQWTPIHYVYIRFLRIARIIYTVYHRPTCNRM